MNGVQEIIEAREEVKEVYKDEPYLKQSQEQKRYNSYCSNRECYFFIFNSSCNYSYI